MSQHKEILLGSGWHTLYSNEVWYLVTATDNSEIVLEARFQTDAPDRTGYPHWARTEFCTSKSDEQAVCRVPYSDAEHVLEASKLSFVPEEIWGKAVEECRKLIPSSEG